MIKIPVKDEIIEELKLSKNYIHFGKMFESENESPHNKKQYFYVYRCPYGYEYWIGIGENEKAAIENRNEIGVNAYSMLDIAKFFNNL